MLTYFTSQSHAKLKYIHCDLGRLASVEQFVLDFESLDM